MKFSVYVGRGQELLHNGMPYDQGRSQGHKVFNFKNLQFYKSISSTIYNGAGKWLLIVKVLNQKTLSNKVVWAGCLIFGLVFVPHEFELYWSGLTQLYKTSME